MESAQPKGVDEKSMFEDIFKGMPFQQVKELCLEQINTCNTQDFDMLARRLFSL